MEVVSKQLETYELITFINLLILLIQIISILYTKYIFRQYRKNQSDLLLKSYNVNWLYTLQYSELNNKKREIY